MIEMPWYLIDFFVMITTNLYYVIYYNQLFATTQDILHHISLILAADEGIGMVLSYLF